MAKSVKSLANNSKGISPNHRQHGSVTELGHNRKVYFRRLRAQRIMKIEERERREDAMAEFLQRRGYRGIVPICTAMLIESL